MPTPDRASMRSQATMGTTVVLLLILLLVGLPHASSPPPFSGSGIEFRSVGLSLLYIEAFLALVCLCGLMWGDPGTLKRSPERCFPLPSLVLEKLRTDGTLDGLENVYENGQIYCVRCCIWRSEPNPPLYRENVHHCSTCQRCVVDFDHHCGGQPGTVELPSAVSIAFVRVSCAASRCRATQFSGGASQERDGAATWASLKARHEPVYIEIAAQAH